MASEYTRELIEHAVQQMLSPDPEVQAKAAQLIEDWKQSDNSHILAFAILTQSSLVYARFYSMLVIKESVVRRWDRLPEDFRNALRSYLCEVLATLNARSHLFSSTCDLISLIGVFDWPERWPNFLSDILSGNIKPLIQLSLLDRFTSTITDGIYVTHTRRAKLLGVMLELSPKINAAVHAGLAQEESIPIAFSVLDTQLKTDALMFWLKNGIVTKLSDDLLPQPMCQNGAIQCLNTIFIDRYDCFKLAPLYLPQLLRSFVINLKPDKSFLLPRATSPSLLLLVEKVLFRHCSFICYLLSGMRSEIDIEGAFSSVTVPDLGIAQQDIIILLKIILSNKPDEKQIDVYWALWRSLLPHLFTPPMSEVPIAPDIESLLPMIHESLFSVLPSVVSEHTMIDTVARICWSTFISLFPKEVAEFMKHQPPSVALCYGMGYAELTLPPELLKEVYDVQTPALLAHLTTANDVDYGNGVLFALSHSGSQQLENPAFFKAFIDYALSCLAQDEESVKVEATHALHYVAKRHPQLFLVDGLAMAHVLAATVDNFVSQFNLDAATRMVKLCSFLASSEGGEMLYPNIITPILDRTSAVTQSDLANPDPETREMAEFLFSLIGEVAPILPTDCVIQFEQPLLATLTAIGGSTQFSLVTLESLVRATATLISCRPDGCAGEPLAQLYATLSGNQSLHYLLFDSVAIIRERHPELDSFWSKIESDFIVPLVKGSIEIDDCTSLFRMVSAFSLGSMNTDNMSNLLVFGLRHAMSTVAISAAKCARRAIAAFASIPVNIDALIGLSKALIPSIVSSLTDGVHTTATGPLVHLLFDLFVKASDVSELDIIKAIFLTSLSELCTEPQPGAFNQIVENLVECVGDDRRFRHTIFDLLVVLRSATPCDLATFDTVVGPPIWMSDVLSAVFSTVVKEIEGQRRDEDFPIQELKDLSLD